MLKFDGITLSKKFKDSGMEAALHDNKAFQVSYYCEKRDLEFDAKMHDVLVI